MKEPSTSPNTPTPYPDAVHDPGYVKHGSVSTPGAASPSRGPASQQANVPPPASPQPGGHSHHDQPQSHVTKVPYQMEGYNFNPQARSQYSNEPGVVHTVRPVEPQVGQISDELRKKHDKSKEDYPFLNLSEGEYVILNIQRHPIGLLIPVGVSTFLIIILLSLLVSYPLIVADTATNTMPGFGLVVLITLSLSVLVAIFGYIAVWVYLRNQFFLTSESVIQELQHSLFSKHEQTASLGSIEDVSFRQTGVLQTMLNYGSIRLSTEGEETTYRFNFVSNPKKQTNILTNAVEAYKNGRPVEG